MIIDFSSHDTWVGCPARWYEKYINKRQPCRPKAQRDDALALGSLVHEGLRIWQLNHLVAIPDKIVEEVCPTGECYNLALELVYGYARAYPEERWPLVFCEEPLTFPLIKGGEYTGCRRCDFEYYGTGEYCKKHDFDDVIWWNKTDLTGLAKIDSYFYVPEATEIETGIPGQQMVLTPGWWIHEYKTKSSDIPIGLYMQQWEMGLQAAYQMIALQGKRDERVPYGQDREMVRGVLVNVLEKPRRYIPKRKCQTCDQYYEFAMWMPTGTGEYSCHACGSKQKLQPLKNDTPTRPPIYYRFLVTRTMEELARWRDQIIMTGQQMIGMEAGGLYSAPWNTKNCTDFRWKRACEYFGPHKNNQSTMELMDFEAVPDYRGLVQIEIT